jgi:hypothetical protein
MTGTSGNNKKKMISLTTIGLAVLIIVIGANVLLWKSNRDRQSEILILNGEISQVQHKIKGTPVPSADLVSRLAAAKNALTEAQNTLPDAINANDIIDYMIDVADQCQVQAVPLVSEGQEHGKSAQPYQVATFSVTVTGSLKNTTNYMTNLQEGRFPTLFITNCAMDKLEDTDFSRPENSTQVTVKLSIAVYTAAPPAGEDATP